MVHFGDRHTFKNEDLLLRVSTAIDPKIWNEDKYELFIDELCDNREYQKDAIKTALRFLFGGKYANTTDLARENFQTNESLVERYGSWAAMERHLQLPNQLFCCIDQATGTGKSYVLYGIAAIALAEGAVDKALVLCPSNTIEDGLLKKFRELAADSDLRDAMPAGARIGTPRIINASETIVDGSICVENYHAILENVGSSIRDSLTGKGSRTLVLNDEVHHVANESGAAPRKWKSFLQNSAFGFRYIVGASGTCYVGDEYFAEVISRYSLREAIEERSVKKVDYVDELPPKAEKPEEKWQLIYRKHQDNKKRLRKQGIRPLTIVVTRSISDAELVAEEICDNLQDIETLTPESAAKKVLCVTSAPRHQPAIAKLKLVDSKASEVEWIVSVAMLSEGWDVKNVFQIVPHEERAFNSKLLISQVLGRGLRRPDSWVGADPIVTVFNHDAWSGRIRHLVNEILEVERRLTSSVDASSPNNFELHNLDYNRVEDATEFAKKGEYNLLQDSYIELPTQVETEDVTVEFERAITGERTKFRTSIQYKTWSASEVAEQMYQRLRAIDEESKDAADPNDRTSYSKKFPRKKCEQIVLDSLKRAGIRTGRVTDDNRQKFLQALGTLRRKSAKRVVYKLSPHSLVRISTGLRQNESCSAAELRRGSKAVFYSPGVEDTLPDEQKEFFAEVNDDDGGYLQGRVVVPNPLDLKTPANFVITDAGPERRFVRELTSRLNSTHIDAWLKNTPVAFYTIEYAWKKGSKPKRGEFSPDLFLKKGSWIHVVEIKGDEELVDPSNENVKKHEYASAHVARLNNWLEKDKIDIRYQFNMITPKSFNAFFQKLREDDLVGFRSELDVVMSGVARTGGT